MTDSRVMSDPCHVFSIQDHLFLDDNNDKNLRKIGKLRPVDGKLAFVLKPEFIEDNLTAVIEALLFVLDERKLKNFW